MGYFSHKIVLDMHSTISQASLSVKLGDTNWKICAILTDNGKTYNIPEGSTAIFTGKKADNTDLFNDCIIEGNAIIYDFTEQTCSAVGRVDCEIRLTDAEGKIITSPSFTIVVENTVVDEDHIIESNNEVQELTKLVNEVETKLENGEFVGEKGEKGDTPVKGVDYYTDEDIAEVLSSEEFEESVKLVGDGYYAKVEDMPKEKAYEHIATITVTAEDSPLPNHVIFSKDSDGKAFELSSFYVKAKIGTTDGYAARLALLVNDTSVFGNATLGLVLSTTPQGWAMYWMDLGENNGALCLAQNLVAGSAFPSSPSINNYDVMGGVILPYMTQFAPVKKIDFWLQVGTAKTFVAGTTFELWGVRK